MLGFVFFARPIVVPSIWTESFECGVGVGVGTQVGAEIRYARGVLEHAGVAMPARVKMTTDQ